MAVSRGLGMRREDDERRLRLFIGVFEVLPPDLEDVTRWRNPSSARPGDIRYLAPVVDHPARRHLDDAARASPDNLVRRDLVADSRVIRLEVPCHQAAVVEKTLPLQQSQRSVARLPQRSTVTVGTLPGDPPKGLDALYQHGLLFGSGEPGWRLVAVTMVRDLVAARRDELDATRKCVGGMPGHEERPRDAVVVQQPKDTGDPDRRVEFAARERGGVRLTLVEPGTLRVDVERETDGAPFRGFTHVRAPYARE